MATYLGGGTETSSVKQGVTLSRQTAPLHQDLCVARIWVDIVPVIDRDLDWTVWARSLRVQQSLRYVALRAACACFSLFCILCSWVHRCMLVWVDHAAAVEVVGCLHDTVNVTWCRPNLTVNEPAVNRKWRKHVDAVSLTVLNSFILSVTPKETNRPSSADATVPPETETLFLALANFRECQIMLQMATKYFSFLSPFKKKKRNPRQIYSV